MYPAKQRRTSLPASKTYGHVRLCSSVRTGRGKPHRLPPESLQERCNERPECQHNAQSEHDAGAGHLPGGAPLSGTPRSAIARLTCCNSRLPAHDYEASSVAPRTQRAINEVFEARGRRRLGKPQCAQFSAADSRPREDMRDLTVFMDVRPPTEVAGRASYFLQHTE